MSKEITFDSLYRELPQIDDEDPEFLIGLFTDAKQNCLDDGIDVSVLNIVKAANHIFIRELDSKSRNDHWHLWLSLCDPGIEVYRYLAPIADRVGVEVSPTPLWEYVTPNVTVAFSLRNWDRAHRIIGSVPELAQELRTLEEKPAMHLLDFGDERGLVAVIDKKEGPIVIKNALGDQEMGIAKRVSGIVGPEVKYTGDAFIAEEYLTGHSLHKHDAPDVIGSALGVALKKAHALGIAYLDRFDRGHVKINSQNGKVQLVDWSSAKAEGDKNTDIRNAVLTIKDWLLDDKDGLFTALSHFAHRYKS